MTFSFVKVMENNRNEIKSDISLYVILSDIFSNKSNVIFHWSINIQIINRQQSLFISFLEKKQV